VGKELQISDWILAFFASIIFGHLLQGVSEMLDMPAAWLLSKFSKRPEAYFEKARRYLEPELPASLRKSCGCLKSEQSKRGLFSFFKESLKESHCKKYLFYDAFDYLRIHDPAAVSELERHAADYKLFRSLTLLILINILLSAAFGPFHLWQFVLSLVILPFVALRFLQIFNFTYGLAFHLYLQVRKATASEKTQYFDPP
jgi:hypothetical protein